MTRTVDAAFAAFDQNLNLNVDERLRAQERHSAIRQVLTAGDLVSNSFLQGSFARKTMLKPLKDVDIVCLLDPEQRDQLLIPSGPGLAMEAFKPPIHRRWPEVEFDVGDEPSGKALRLSFPDCSFTVDLVPAFEENDEWVLIGDRHEGTWTPSNTRIQLRVVRERNVACNGRFVHQVRELKAFRACHDDDLEFLKGIVIESLAYAVITRELPDKLAVAEVLRHARTAVLGPITDPAGDDDVAIKWSYADRQKASKIFADASAKADEALAMERAGAMVEAIDLWHAVLGEDFPEAPVRSIASTMAAWASGSLTSTGRPSSTRAGRQAAAPGRAWRAWRAWRSS